MTSQDQQGRWHWGNLEQAQLRPLGRVETTMEVRGGKPTHANKHPGEVEIAACPVRLTSWSQVPGPGEQGQRVQKVGWVGQVRVLGTSQEPWVLVSDWPVEDAKVAVPLFTRSRHRWRVEDTFKVSTTCLGWEQVQVLDGQGLRTLLALGWVAAGLLSDLGKSPGMDRGAPAGRLGRLATSPRS